MTDSPTEDELLETLRLLVGGSSVRRVAKRMGIAHTTLADLLDPESQRRPYGPTLEKVAEFILKHGGRPLPGDGKNAVREEGAKYAPLPDRLAVAMGALEVIRDAAELALQRVRATSSGSASPAEGSKPAEEVLAANRLPGPPHRVGESGS